MQSPVRNTEYVEFPSLNEMVGAKIIFVSELQQQTHSFKFRAAWSVVSNIEAEGFIAASSGNFGQALAYACLLQQRKCIVVMPTTSAQVKIDAVRAHGAEVVFVDTSIQSRADKVAEIAQSYPSFYVASAYDCDWVIQGNSSLGDEIVHKMQIENLAVDAIVVPVGGGGLISGISMAVRKQKCTSRIIGAEPAMADDAYRSLQVGQICVNQGEPQTIADGARTHSVGAKNWKIISTSVDGIVLVSEQEIVKAVQMFHSVGIRVEPTGALGLAGVCRALKNGILQPNSCVMAVISGGNVDETIYQSILQGNI